MSLSYSAESKNLVAKTANGLHSMLCSIVFTGFKLLLKSIVNLFLTEFFHIKLFFLNLTCVIQVLKFTTEFVKRANKIFIYEIRWLINQVSHIEVIQKCLFFDLNIYRGYIVFNKANFLV